MSARRDVHGFRTLPLLALLLLTIARMGPLLGVS